MLAAEPQFKKFQKELNAGLVSLVLLTVIERDGEPLYGYQIAKQLEKEEATLFVGKQSALYPVLRNMSAAGLLESWVEPSVSGPPRRYYRITDAGRAALTGWQTIWEATRSSVDAILDGDRND